MDKALFLILVFWVSSFSIFAQQHELVSNILCQEFAVDCQTNIKQELTVVSFASEFYRMFPEHYNSDKKTGCQLPDIDFNRFFLVVFRPRSLLGCKEPKVVLQINWKEGDNLSVNAQITERGNCYRLWPDVFYVKVPKPYYTKVVDFSISKEVKTIGQ